MLDDRYYLLDLKERAAIHDRMYFLDRDGIYVNGQRITEDPTLPASMPLVAINPDPAYWGFPFPAGADAMTGIYDLAGVDPPCDECDRPKLCNIIKRGTRPCDALPGDDAVSYRPITDLWILARPKVKYYGAYPSGFLSRARALLGVRPEDPVLHVCSGKVREYPFAGVGPNDMTLDGESNLAPDFLIDVTEDTPLPPGFAAILTDPPYTPEDAAQYGSLPFPSASALMKKCLEAVAVGSRVGMLHYEWPACPDFAREVAVVGVTTGRRQRMRHFVVMERTQ